MAARVNGGNGYKTCGSGTSPLLSLLLFSKMQKIHLNIPDGCCNVFRGGRILGNLMVEASWPPG